MVSWLLCEEGTTLPSLAASRVALIQHHCSKPISRLFCLLCQAALSGSWHMLFMFSSLAWRLLPLPPESPRISVYTLETYIPGRGPGQRALLPWTYLLPTLILSTAGPEEMHTVLLWRVCSKNATSAPVCLSRCVMLKSPSVRLVPASLQ